MRLVNFSRITYLPGVGEFGIGQRTLPDDHAARAVAAGVATYEETEPSETEQPLPLRARSNDATPRPSDSEPTICQSCGKDFAGTTSPSVALAAHKKSKRH